MSGLAAVAAGGALGASLRYLAVEHLLAGVGLRAPWAILAVNIVGCFAAGVVWAWLDRAGASGEAWRPFLMVGLLGGLTTYSAFGSETVDSLASGRPLQAAASIGLHVVLGVLAVWSGRAAFA